MSTSDWKARDKDRDAAIEVVEAAWADGQIVEADRDHRVEALLRAQTVAEVRMIVHDLQLPDAPPATATATAGAGTPHPYATPQPTPGYPYRQPATGSAPRRSATLVGVLVVLVIVGALGAGLVAAIVGVTSSVDFAGDDATAMPLPGVEPEEGVNVLSRDGYRDLVRAVRESTGSTEAFEAVLYPGYAVVTLPVDRTSQREDRWYWDGELDALDSKGTSSYQRFDLAKVDADLVVRLVKRVRRSVEDPTSWYAIVRTPDVSTGASIWAYSSNEFNESAYLSAEPDGTIVYDSTKQ